jgi:hypothetical protein
MRAGTESIPFYLIPNKEEASMRHRSRVEFKPVCEHVERRALLSAVAVAAAKAHPFAVVSTQIGVGSPSGPFVVNATTPKELNIYVLGKRIGSHAFRPLEDISRKEVVINGVTFKDVKIRSGPVDANGIRDAIITISPRSAIGLSPGSASLTISGPTRHGNPFAHETWEGTAPVTVVAGAPGPTSYQGYVRITTSAAFQSIYIKTSPGSGWIPFTLYSGKPSNFQTGMGTDPSKFEFAFSAYANGDKPSYIYFNNGNGFSTNPSTRPTYNLTVYTQGIFNYVSLVKAT